MHKRIFSLIGAIIWLYLIPCATYAAGPFYEGKTFRIIVGFAAGGGFDLYARAFARHMGKYIPGNPTIIVENITGAGSLISANYLYKVAKPDGLTIGHFSGGLFLSQLLEQPGIEFDSKKFGFIGAANKEDNVCVLNKRSGITSIDRWMASKRSVKLGGLGPGSTFDNTIRILKTGVGLPIHLISGYRGASDIRLAVESGELDGGLWTWDTLKATWRKALDSGDIVVALQTVPKPLPDLPNVPLAFNLAKTDEARQMIEVCIHSPSIFSRPFVLPPGTPNEHLQVLRNAFQETLKDKEFLEETKKVQLGLNPVTGDELEKTVAGIFKLDSTLLAKLKEILFK